MGGVQSEDNLAFILDDYQLVGEEDGLKVLEDKAKEETFALRQQCFANRKEYDLSFKRLTGREENSECENILRLTKLWSKEHSGVCSNVFKIYTVYEYPRVKLIDEIQARHHESKHFDEVELFSILQSCANALVYEPRYVNISPHIIFIIPEGVLKLLHIDLVDPHQRSVYNPHYYYSPEKIEHFQNQGLETAKHFEQESVFCLGMTLLHSALLASPAYCYEISNKRVNKRKLEMMQMEAANMYSPYLSELMTAMLETNPAKRITFEQMQTYIGNFFTEQSRVLKSSLKEGEGKLQINLKRQSTEQKSKQVSRQGGSSLAYSGQTFFKAPSVSLNSKVDTNTKNIKPSEHQIIMELSSSECASIPKSHYMLERTKKSKQRLLQDKENQPIIDSLRQSMEETHKQPLMDMDKPNRVNRMVSSNDVLSEYELNSQQKQKCVFVIESYQDKSRYEGMMQNNLKNGYGKLTYQDGVYYQGNFKNDCIHGKGTLFYGANRPAYSGDWSNNKFNGQGVLYNQIPSILTAGFDYSNFNKIEECWVKFEGNFVNDIKEGWGKIYLTNGETMEGHFTKGLLNGQGLFVKGGEDVRGLWTNNMLTLQY